MKVNLSVGHVVPRKKAYMPIGDQLDAIIKTFKHLKKQGIDIGEDGNELIDHTDWVKEKFAKK